MLDQILSIAGRTGLFKLISSNQKFIIVESLTDKKRSPAYTKERVISLENVAIYTETEEIPLREVFALVYKKEAGKEISINASKADKETLENYLGEVLPEFDRDRVYTKDIKKLIQWYNLLIKNDLTDFSDPEEKEEEEKK